MEENRCETLSTSTGTGRTEVMDTGAPESGKENGSPNVRMGQKRTINSPVTIKKLPPIKKLKKKEIKRKPVGIKKAQSKILTSTLCRKLIEENNKKKTLKRMRKTKIAKKLEELKKEVAKKEREEKKQPTKSTSKEGSKKASKEKEGHPEVWKEATKHPKNTRQSKIIDLSDWKIKHTLINKLIFMLSYFMINITVKLIFVRIYVTGY